MTLDPMHIALGGGCLVMTGISLRLFHLLTVARAEGRTLALYREMQRRNGKKGAEKRQAGTQAMTERLKREAAQKRSATLNEERRAVWL